MNKPVRLLVALIPLLALSSQSCRMTPKVQSAQSATLASAGGLSAKEIAAQWFKAEPSVPVIQGDESRKEVARLLVSSCRNPAVGSVPFLSRWELDLQTPFGFRPARFSVSRYGMKVLVRGYLGEESTEFISQASIPDEWMKMACARVNDSSEPGESPVVATREVVDAISAWLAGFAPDCNSILQAATPETPGWKCSPASPEPWISLIELEKTRQTMISGWTRQPYLLARRIAIGINIASALQESSAEPDPRPALKKACAVISRSLKHELPLILDDPRISDTFCGQMTSPVVARAMAATVAAKIASEASALREIFENTSKTGSLTVSLPPAEQPGSTYLVTLKPEEDVVLGLAKFTQAMLIERQNAERNSARRRASNDPVGPAGGFSDVVQDSGSILGYACWHPLFDGNHQRLSIAQELGLVNGPNQAGGCSGREGPGSGGASDDASWTPQRYVAESITSDTEFLVTNGETKTLRLPAGTYSYTVQVLQQVSSALEDSAMPAAAPVAVGKIEWLAPRPRTVIKEPAAG